MKQRTHHWLASLAFALGVTTTLGCGASVADASGGDVPASDTGAPVPQHDGAPVDAPPSITINPCNGTTPTALVASSDTARSVATDGVSMYWTTWPTARSKGKVFVASLAARTPILLADDEDEPTEIGVDGGRVYWVDHGRSLRSVATSGGAITTVFEGTVEHLAIASANDAHHVVFSADTSIYRVSSGGDVAELFSADAHADALTVDADAVYWVRQDGSASVHRRAFALGRDETLALGLGVSRQTSLAVDAQNVWVASMDSGMLWKIGLADARTTIAASGLHCPDTVRADGASVFLANSSVACAPSFDLSTRAILQYSAADVRAKPLGIAPAEHTGIDGRFAVDDRNVYWAGRDGAQSYVYCVAKR